MWAASFTEKIDKQKFYHMINIAPAWPLSVQWRDVIGSTVHSDNVC